MHISFSLLMQQYVLRSRTWFIYFFTFGGLKLGTFKGLQD